MIVVRAKRHETVVELAAVLLLPGDQRADRLRPSLPGHGRPVHDPRDGRPAGGHTLAWIGDGNNVARSLAVGCGKLGMRFVMATPPGYRFDEHSCAGSRREVPELDLTVTDDPVEAVRDAVAVYTDVWASMGQEAEAEKRRRDFAAYQVNAASDVARARRAPSSCTACPPTAAKKSPTK